MPLPTQAHPERHPCRGPRGVSFTTTFTFTFTLIGLALSCSGKSDPADRAKQPAAAGDDAAATAPRELVVPPAPPLPAVPLGLPEPPVAEHNPDTAEKVALGELLFFDPRLSEGGERSCADCHPPERGWSDGKPLSATAAGAPNSRHTPTLCDVAYGAAWGWDGRHATLEQAVMAEWTRQLAGAPASAVARLAAIPEYRVRFERAFALEPDPNAVVEALASFLRVRARCGDSPWDRYEAGDRAAVSEAARAGFEVFGQKANCSLCHTPPLYTDSQYHNAGAGYREGDEPDPGRARVTGNAANNGAFKTPTLRGVASHPPYLHDGSAATLEEAIDFMLGGGYRERNPHIDGKLAPIRLTPADRANLIEFLKALTPAAPPPPPPALP